MFSRKLIFTSIFLVAILVAFLLFRDNSPEIEFPPAQTFSELNTSSIEEDSESLIIDETEIVEESPETENAENLAESSDSREESLKPSQSSINLAVPFLVQAPTGNWALPFAETCEEVSVKMVNAYFQNQTDRFKDPQKSEQLIVEVVEKQKEILDGIWIDTGVELTKKFAEEIFPISMQVVENPTIEQIKSELIAGYPVIVPADGRKLQNPFFSGAGPDYHMLVIRGFNEKGFITNEPGTRRGENYIYPFEILMNALADWHPELGLQEDRPVVLFSRPKFD